MKVTDEERVVRATREAARNRLLGMRVAQGHWEGRLSSSALSTATAIVALELAGSGDQDVQLISEGRRWLLDHQNADGGWGDTVLSDSNLSTTLLCLAALRVVADEGPGRLGGAAASTEARAARWIEERCGDLEPGTLARALADRYGRDRTFSVPILMVCALGGLLGGDRRAAWRQVLALPFELATVPRRCFAFLRFPVVSYALPALIAIGYARFVMAPPAAPLRWVRRWAWPRASRLLREIQPEGGGFLEATPLTGFVTMALAVAGERGHPVVAGALDFLRRSVRGDGSWPIDTNLATWVTTLAVKAVAAGEEGGRFAGGGGGLLRSWLLGQQYLRVHPFTDAAPGGWAWTDLSGGVPDADDTAGALLALFALAEDPGNPDGVLVEAASAGCRWLVNLQNRDGGIPTFCRGWGTLPFDRSTPDLTAHALRAWHAWFPHLEPGLRARVHRARKRAFAYLGRAQREDGAWVPLWFGNQHAEEEENPVYGTAKVLVALADVADEASVEGMIGRAVDWLVAARHADGGWGGAAAEHASIEETSLALDALAAVGDVVEVPPEVLWRAAAWLAERTREGTRFPPAPIGFYFARLWYFEEMYPLVWTVSAFGRLLRR